MSARYFCVAWLAPYVDSVEFEVTTLDGGVYAKVVAARRKKLDRKPDDLSAAVNGDGQTSIEVCTSPSSNVVEEYATGVGGWGGSCP